MSDSGTNKPRFGDTSLLPGEELLAGFHSLIQAVKIHNENNQLVINCIQRFMNSVNTLLEDADDLTIQVSKGQFYIQEEKLVHRRNTSILVDKVLKYFDDRELMGLRIYPVVSIAPGEEIVAFAKYLNNSLKQKNPMDWLVLRFEESKFQWIAILQPEVIESTDASAGLGFGEGESGGEGSGAGGEGPAFGTGSSGVTGNEGSGGGSGGDGKGIYTGLPGSRSGDGTGSGYGSGSQSGTGKEGESGIGPGIGDGSGAGSGSGTGPGDDGIGTTKVAGKGVDSGSGGEGSGAESGAGAGDDETGTSKVAGKGVDLGSGDAGSGSGSQSATGKEGESGIGPGIGGGSGAGSESGTGAGGDGTGTGKGAGAGKGAGKGRGKGRGKGGGKGRKGGVAGEDGASEVEVPGHRSPRKVYAYALESMREVAEKISINQRAGIRNAVRIVQNMVEEVVLQEQPLLLAMSTIKVYDDYTFTHSVNVAILCMYLGKQIGVSKETMESLGISALFHDLGKVLIPQGVLNKEGPLNSDEINEIRKHSLNSIRLIVRLRASAQRKTRILLPPFEHHLRFDLNGYPNIGWKRPVSLCGRILTICDVYDALTSPRVYRQEAMSADRALGLMLEGSGTVFDPILLKVFINMLGVYPVGTLLELDNGDIGLVCKAPTTHMMNRPMVILLEPDGRGGFLKGEEVDLADKDDSGFFYRNVTGSIHPAVFNIQPAEFLSS